MTSFVSPPPSTGGVASRGEGEEGSTEGMGVGSEEAEDSSLCGVFV